MTVDRWLRAGPRREARDRLLVEAYQTGLSLQEVGDRFGVTAPTVANALKRAGIARRPGGGSTERGMKAARAYLATPEQIAKREEYAARNAQIVAARAAGETLAAIGARYGITRERVRQILEVVGGKAAAE